jgi:hypothetical protein
LTREDKRVGISDIFSKRKKQAERAGKPDVYQYNQLPEPFRVQVSHIWRTSIGKWRTDDYGESVSNEVWQVIFDKLCRELGMFKLGGPVENPAGQCLHYLMTADTDGALDIIELSFRAIDRMIRDVHPVMRAEIGITQDPDMAIRELNDRFREHGAGYQYSAGIIIRVDNQFVHSETVKPALALLNEPGFDGPSEEFIKAFDHYRHGRNKEAVAEALKALESTLKAICRARRWTHPPNATVKPLLDIVFEKGLVPAEYRTHFGGLRSAMESGLPTLSNRTSRHGQGADPQPIPPHFVAYALNLAASNIVFLIEAHKAVK